MSETKSVRIGIIITSSKELAILEMIEKAQSDGYKYIYIANNEYALKHVKENWKKLDSIDLFIGLCAGVYFEI